jgi:hypothetical protein
MKKNIEIDFFELMILIESSWHGMTALRYSVIEKAIDTWYNCLEKSEIERLYDIVKRNCGELNTELHRKFYARYNPDNQYLVTATDGAKTEPMQCFLFEGNYHINSRTTFQEKFIVKVEKIVF